MKEDEDRIVEAWRSLPEWVATLNLPVGSNFLVAGADALLARAREYIEARDTTLAGAAGSPNARLRADAASALIARAQVVLAGVEDQTHPGVRRATATASALSSEAAHLCLPRLCVLWHHPETR